MRYTIQVTDKDTGDVLLEGEVLSLKFTTSNHSGTTFDIQGSGHMNGCSPIKRGSVVIDTDNERPKDSCNHVWKTYNGFTETYDYCGTCGAKK